MNTAPWYLLIVYVPEADAERLKKALFGAGAGRLGNYDHCAWHSEGTGQFRPLPGSRPAIGSTGNVEHVPEAKIEVTCRGECLSAVVAALRQAHPYETPAFMYWPVGGIDEATEG
jgi:hypothetical protein